MELARQRPEIGERQGSSFVATRGCAFVLSREWWGRQGEIDGEHAARAGEIAHVQPATVRLDAATADGQPQTEAGSLGAELRERLEELLRSSVREAATFVLDVDQEAITR